MNYSLFTSESVCAGHPDKICDQISDAVLDACLSQDPYSHTGIECLVTSNKIIVSGETKTTAKLNYEKIARRIVKDLGYNKNIYNFNYKTADVEVLVHQQSSDIALGVDPGGAGDQGCIKKGSLVKTKQGFLPIEKVKKGMEVITVNDFKKVKAAKKTGVKNIIELIFACGKKLECTPDHRILCFNKAGKTYWKAAQELSAKDYICTLKPSGFKTKNYYKSKVNKELFFTKYNHKLYGPKTLNLNKNVAYILGLTIGDGYIVKKGVIEISFGSNLKFAKLVKKIVDQETPNQWRIITTKSGTVSLKVDSILIRKHFENFGVAYKKAAFKTTPSKILTSSNLIIQAYLKGLFDADGTIVTNTGREERNIRIRLSSSSYRLLQETQLLLAEFDIKSSILFNAPKGKPVGKNSKYQSNYNNYVLSLVGFESYQNFGKNISFSHPKKKLRMSQYLKRMTQKPINSPGIYLIPHPKKNELIDEKRLNKNLNFGITTLKEKKQKGHSEVYDLHTQDNNMFSSNGIYVHNSMFGYACNETPELMPLPIMLAHGLVRKMDQLHSQLPYLRPDGKSQVVVKYRQGKPVRVEKVVLAKPHDPKANKDQVKQDLYKKAVLPVLRKYRINSLKIDQVVLNGTGKWEIGGPDSDMGETGRKIVVDSYGGMGRVGGGCFSGKCPTKVDRSGAYAARYIAKNIVAAGLAKRCEVQIGYVIGQARPICQAVETFGTAKKDQKVIEAFAWSLLDLSVAGITNGLKLRRPIYQATATYGHFGNPKYPWEKVIK